MGIPQFKRHLEPYAERALIEPCNVVLDGPALAYHILNLCSRTRRKGSPLEQPSYQLLGKTAVAWLHRIQACGLSVSAIYFDGYLPNSKRNERIQRLLKSSRDLIRYHSTFLTGVPKGRADGGGDADADLFPSAWPGEHKAKPPPPPFLVPAIIDALRESSEFSSCVRLVPGEADGFCAEHVRRHGGTVLTSDSDLLVHDLGETGGVIFFPDIDAGVEMETLVAPQYRPADLCRRLSLRPETGLQYLAFEVSRDPHLTLEQAIEKSKRREAIPASGEEYSNFMEQYHSPGVASQFQTDEVPTLDPRLSELFLRAFRGSKKAVAPVSEPGPGNGLDIYLPFLLDCPNRASAWEASKPVRQLSYAILQSFCGNSIPSVTETRRLQSVSSGSRVEVPKPTEAKELGTFLLTLCTEIEDGISDSESIWVVLSVYQDIVMTLDRGRGNPLSLALLEQEARGGLDQCSWDFLHLVAQAQATYYSLRMLRQIIELSAQYTGSLCTTMSELARFLSRLPSLPGFPTCKNFLENLQRAREAGLLSCLRSLCVGYGDIILQIQSIEQPPESKRPKKKRRTMPPSSQKTAEPRSSNPFNLLAAKGEEL
ncbi:XPG domain containing-domain-containing protein [Chaetomium strumarium]|uniref:XPG domain containing-domain-containing protein n=1 Tax=Chaetomium strumarium TaxID=1170767 RepID=A0AAJ0M2U4_9PEZI|nr:XPG domain containing-domain-containing protein [Chaetomium strumarium]